MAQRINRAVRLGAAMALLCLTARPEAPPPLITGTAAPLSHHAAPESDERPNEEGRPLPAGRQVMPPVGYIAFCLRNPSDCTGGNDHPAPMHLSSDRWRELNDINDYVNATIPERDDLSLYGAGEYWTYADTKRGGDCEDLALLKQRLLTQGGWPLSALAIAVVRRWNGEGHAVLLVTTDHGDLVLDNMTWKILPWHRTPYEWVMRQSHRRPYVWVSLDPDGWRKAPSLADLPPIDAEPPFVAAARRLKQITASLAGASPSSMP